MALRYAGLKQKGIDTGKIYQKLIMGDDESAQQYIKNFYENQPVFEKMPPTYDTPGALENRWPTIAEFILSKEDKQL